MDLLVYLAHQSEDLPPLAVLRDVDMTLTRSARNRVTVYARGGILLPALPPTAHTEGLREIRMDYPANWPIDEALIFPW